jgi:hypothetical protein
VTLQELGRLDEAEASLVQAIALKVDYIEAMLNISIVLDYMNYLEAQILSLKNITKIDADNKGLKAGVNLAICNFLKEDFLESRKQLEIASKIQEKVSIEFKNEKRYYHYLIKIMNWHENRSFNTYNIENYKTLFVIGESHCLVSHKLHIKHLGNDFLCKAKLIMGCMQWHLGNSSRNQYKNKFESILQSIPKSSDILLAIGEIDCRLDSGIIKHKNKFPEKQINKIIATTIKKLSYLHLPNKFQLST